MDEADRLCDRLAIIDRGRVVACDTPKALKDALGGDVVTLTMEPDGPSPDWAALLGGIAQVKDVRPDGPSVTITVDSGAQALPRILEATTKAGVAVHAVALLRPSLDAVFLHHTGRRIAEAEAAAA
jgi:ABC-2 type transport system ATP-binding protein